MNSVLETVREMIAKGHSLEAAAYVKRLAPVPMSEDVARGLLSMLADVILQPVSRGRGDKFDSDPLSTIGIEYAIYDDVCELRSSGSTLEDAFATVGERRHKSPKTVERIYRKFAP